MFILFPLAHFQFSLELGQKTAVATKWDTNTAQQKSEVIDTNVISYSSRKSKGFRLLCSV